MKGQDYQPTPMEKLLAQWPAFAGVALIAVGLLYVWYVKMHPPHILYTKPVIYSLAGGVVLIMFWAFRS